MEGTCLQSLETSRARGVPCRALSARVFRGAETENLDSEGARDRAEVHRRRRTRLIAGRFGEGSDSYSAAEPTAAGDNLLPLYFTRPELRKTDQPTRHRDVPREDNGVRGCRPNLRPSSQSRSEERRVGKECRSRWSRDR